MAGNTVVKSETHWYIVRAVPGTQRQAKAYSNLSGGRAGESILERECRNEGFNIYMPSFWATTRHQRTNKLKDRRFPLLVGYAFVNAHEAALGKLRDLDSVGCVMKYGTGEFAVLREEDVGQIMLADHLRTQAHKIEREGSAQKAMKHRRNQLEKRLGQILPKGRRKKIPVRMMAQAELGQLPPDLRKHVQGILDGIIALEQEANTCEELPFGLNLVA